MVNHEVAATFAVHATGAAATSHHRIDVTEVHDFFTAPNRISYEGVGFAEQFGGCKIVEAEATSIGGDLLVNMRGASTATGGRVAYGG